MNLVKSNIAGLSVDEKAGAIVNIDENEYLRFKAERDRAVEFQKMKNDISKLKQAVENLQRLIEEKLNG